MNSTGKNFTYVKEKLDYHVGPKVGWEDSVYLLLLQHILIIFTYSCCTQKQQQ